MNIVEVNYQDNN